MNKENFWSIIENAKKNSNEDYNKLTENFEKELNLLSEQDLLHFQFLYEIYEIAIISVPSNLIWTAQFLMNKGFYSDTYKFAGWLIIQGKETYINTLLNADTLADIYTPKKSYEYDNLRLLASKLYRERMNVKIRAYQKIESEFWKKPESKKEETEIKNEIVYNNIKRDRNWELSDLKTILPNLYNKVI